VDAHGRSGRALHACLADQLIDNGAESLCRGESPSHLLVIEGELPISTGTVRKNNAHVLDLGLAAKVLRVVMDQLQEIVE
jgi:hypothetical protein